METRRTESYGNYYAGKVDPVEYLDNNAQSKPSNYKPNFKKRKKISKKRRYDTGTLIDIVQ